jgi:hypothetical protein
MPHQLGSIHEFNVDDLVEASARLRRIGRDKPFMVDAADDVAQYLYAALDACVGVVVHKSHEITELPSELAMASTSAPVGPGPRHCLAQLAAVGRLPSRGTFAHASVPLDADALRPSSLVGRAFGALAVTVDEVLDPLVAQRQAIQRRSLGAFHLDIAGADLPFAERAPLLDLGVQSVVAFGGGLLTGQVFVVWLLAAVPVPLGAATLFRSLAPAVQSALVPTTFRTFR